jgi:hypothetical protein
MLKPRSNWSRPLPRSLVIPDVMTLATLADVRELIGQLSADRRARSTWRYVAAQLTQAANGKIQPAEAAAALVVVLALESVICRTK